MTILFFRDREETCHSTFEEFYNAVNKNLAGADLLEYDFKDCNLNNYNFKNAILPSKVMIKLGTYGSQYFDNFCKDKYLAEYTPSTSLELITSRQMLQYNEYLGEDNDFLICYISDLHLNHKLFDKFSKCVNEFEIKAYLRSAVKSLKASIEDFKEYKNVLFVGDISFNFDILKMFFEIYKEEFAYATTFFILGNHELWDKSLIEKCKTIEE